MTAVDPNLVTIEVAERLIGRAYEALLEGKTTRAKALLIAAAQETSMRTVSAQRTFGDVMAVSDEIARQAAVVVRKTLADLDAEDAAVAAILAGAPVPCPTCSAERGHERTCPRTMAQDAAEGLHRLGAGQ